MMWFGGFSGEIRLDSGQEPGARQSSGRVVHGSKQGGKEADQGICAEGKPRGPALDG